jgi:hypothetical protein
MMSVVEVPVSGSVLASGRVSRVGVISGLVILLVAVIDTGDVMVFPVDARDPVEMITADGLAGALSVAQLTVAGTVSSRIDSIPDLIVLPSVPTADTIVSTYDPPGMRSLVVTTRDTVGIIAPVIDAILIDSLLD